MTLTLDPERYDAVLFDLDGIVTDTASVHAAAWSQMFDDFLEQRAAREGADPTEDRRPFSVEDYHRHVDGKLRQDGVAAFLASRRIRLPYGEPGDGPDVETVHGLGNRKDQYFLARLQDDGVVVFASTVELVRRLQAIGLGTAVFSASRNCRQVLEAAGLGDLFGVRVDGVVAAELGLPGKPDPATLLEAARRLGAAPARAVVVEDALSGVAAGRRGGFGLVIGVDRVGQAEELRAHGADVVVTDLAEVTVAQR
jgi:beta-phosphoglucomutase family hydrolase